MYNALELAIGEVEKMTVEELRTSLIAGMRFVDAVFTDQEAVTRLPLPSLLSGVAFLDSFPKHL